MNRVKYLRQLWWHWHESLGIFLWMIAALTACLLFWIVFDRAERLWR